MGLTQHALLFPLTLEGIDAAEEDLAKIKKSLATSNGSQIKPAPAKQKNAAVVLHTSMDPNRSREFIEILGVKGETFAELIPKMKPEPGGKPLTKGQMRAIYRNVRRREESLTRAGKIPGEVVKADFTKYDTDQGGRYSLLPDDRAALDDHLK